MKKEYKKMSLLNYLILTSFLLVIAFTQFHILMSFGQKIETLIGLYQIMKPNN